MYDYRVYQDLRISSGLLVNRPESETVQVVSAIACYRQLFSPYLNRWVGIQ
jgi:hypothetical protein